MSYLSPTNSLDDIDYDEMEDVTDVFERHHLDGNGDYQGISGEDNQMDQGPYDADDYSDLPSVLIVTGVPECVYEDQSYRNEFESLFKAFEPMPEFYYLKCFRRARVVYESSNSATHARIQMHERYFHGSIIKCYFAQMPVISDPSSSSPFLLPPKPDKQFLISPPSSPPVGWESVSEKEPVINYDLLAAIANLAPGESHEIHAASDRLPGIVVHVCEDPEGFKNRPRLLQTSCPHPSTERALGNLCIRVNGCPALQGFERKDQFPYDDVKTVGEHLVYIVITSRETGRDRWLYTEPVWYENLSGVVSCPENI